jgi:hypothetical protein
VFLTEVYRVKATYPLQKYPLGTWTPHGGLCWPKTSFYQRRDNLQGLVLRTAFLKVCVYVCSLVHSSTKHCYLRNYFSVIYLSFVNIICPMIKTCYVFLKFLVRIPTETCHSCLLLE